MNSATDIDYELDKAVKKTGDTMQGPLVLQGSPTSPAMAADKAYVDHHDQLLNLKINAPKSSKGQRAYRCMNNSNSPVTGRPGEFGTSTNIAMAVTIVQLRALTSMANRPRFLR